MDTMNRHTFHITTHRLQLDSFRADHDAEMNRKAMADRHRDAHRHGDTDRLCLRLNGADEFLTNKTTV